MIVNIHKLILGQLSISRKQFKITGFYVSKEDLIQVFEKQFEESNEDRARIEFYRLIARRPEIGFWALENITDGRLITHPVLEGNFGGNSD